MNAAVLEKIGAPLTVKYVRPSTHGENDLLVDENQVFVQVLCTGICGSQIQEIDGIKGDPAHLPHLLGHEGCGIVQATGINVKTLKQGDKVVLHWRKGAGHKSTGGAFGEIKFGPINTFSEYVLVSENRVTKIDNDVPNDFAALLGCALSTALAIVENEANIKRGDKVLVVGCGGVGLALILASVAAGGEVHGTDIHNKRDLVESLGALFVHTYGDIGGLYDVVLDTTGSLMVSGCRYISLQPGGTSAGMFLPTVDIPRYVQMWRDGLLNDYPKLITHRIRLDQINEGIQLMRAGKAGRVMIDFEHDCPHVPRCFDGSAICWNYDESHKRAMSLPNYP